MTTVYEAVGGRDGFEGRGTLDMTFRLLHTVIIIATGIATGCGDVKSVFLHLDTCHNTNTLVAGDSTLASAVAYASEMSNVFAQRYSSWEDLDQFRFASDPPSFLRTERNRIVALTPGVGELTATVEGVVGRLPLVVLAPTDHVDLTIPATIRLLDTIRVRFHRRDQTGQSLPALGDAHFFPDSTQRFDSVQDSIAQSILVARRTGSSIMRWCYAGRHGMVLLTVAP
jgi:hypothetical protein